MNCPKHGEQATICRFCDLDTLLANVAGVPCRFCMGPGSDSGACPDCGKPRAESREEHGNG